MSDTPDLTLRDYYGVADIDAEPEPLRCHCCGRPAYFSYVDGLHHSTEPQIGCDVIAAGVEPPDPHHPLVTVTGDVVRDVRPDHARVIAASWSARAGQ